MPAPIVIPFNFDPIATTVRTANYTIPAGRYAKITPLPLPEGTNFNQHITSGNLTISNRNLALNSSPFFYYAGAGSVRNTVTSTITFPLASHLSITMFDETGGGAYGINIDGSTFFSFSNINPRYMTFEHFCRSVTFVSSGAAYGATVSAKEVNLLGTNFWAKAGDVISINVSGRFLTEEYNKIS